MIRTLHTESNEVINCHSSLPARTLCYAGVLQDTCNASAADINILKTILYNAKFSWFVSTSCALGESVWYLCRCSKTTNVCFTDSLCMWAVLCWKVTSNQITHKSLVTRLRAVILRCKDTFANTTTLCVYYHHDYYIVKVNVSHTYIRA